jgi:hypothetical protein
MVAPDDMRAEIGRVVELDELISRLSAAAESVAATPNARQSGDCVPVELTMKWKRVTLVTMWRRNK